MGTAVYQAGEEVRRQMIERAARIWDVPVEDVEYQEDGALAHKSDDALRMTFDQLARRLNGTGGPIVGHGAANPAGVGNAFAINVADVEVDPDTGQGGIAALYRHPGLRQGDPPQLRGGPDTGRSRPGHRLGAERRVLLQRPRGRCSTRPSLDYRMPTALDLPMIDTVIVEVPNPGHPLGVRGVGEVSPGSAHGRHRQRHRPGDGGQAGQPAHEPGGRAGSAVGAGRRVVSSKHVVPAKPEAEAGDGRLSSPLHNCPTRQSDIDYPLA